MAIKFTKQKGEVIRKDELYRQFENYLNTLKNGDYSLFAKIETIKRTVNQNHLMWLWFTCLSNETGNTKEDFHAHYCEMFLRVPDKIKADKLVTIGTSKLDTVQFIDFLNKVQADAASEFGIKLPTPQDLYWAEFENEYKNRM